MSEEAGDRQLGHPLQNSPPPMPSPMPAKAGDVTIIMIAALKSSFFMTLSHGPALGSSRDTSTALLLRQPDHSSRGGSFALTPVTTLLPKSNSSGPSHYS
jgi:hypothetical protein